MKKKLTLFFLLWICGYSYSQKQGQVYIDSLLSELTHSKADSQSVNLYMSLLIAHASFKPEEGLKYEKPALELAKKIHATQKIAFIKRKAAFLYHSLGRYQESMQRNFEALSIYEEMKDAKGKFQSLRFLGQNFAEMGSYGEALSYFSKALVLAESGKMLDRQADIHSLLAWVYEKMGDYPQATKSNLASLKINEQIGNTIGIAVATSNVAGYYSKMDNYTDAMSYFIKSAEAFKQAGDNNNLASVYIDMGSLSMKMGKINEALSYYNLSLKLSRDIKNDYQVALAQEFIGNWYVYQGKYAEALEFYLTAAAGYREVSNIERLSFVLSSAGICYTRLKKYKEADNCFSEAWKLLNDVGNPQLYTEYYGGVEILDSAKSDWKNAYFHYKSHILTRDSIDNAENNKKSLKLNMQYEFDKKEALAIAEREKKDAIAAADLRRQKMLRNGFLIGFAVMLLFAGVFFGQRNRIKKGKKRSDELLLNILPAEVAEELKTKGKAEARHFDSVSVLFTDFKNFTNVSENLSPQELVNEINYCYSEFDMIISQFGIEKIKTIGDAYMCAGGLPVANQTNAEDCVRAALAIRDFMKLEKQRREAEGNSFFEIRIGIHTGPVVAGIVGIKKFAYDIWGDTVNIASRMESSGEPGKINISNATYELVKNKFTCTHRGKIQAKNKGEVDMYFVEHL